MNARLLRSYKFFRSQEMPAHAAVALARGEQFALDNDYTFCWEDDPEGARNWYCHCGCRPSKVLACVMYGADGEVLASLGSIGDPDQNYCRMIEAELSLEVMP